MKFLFVTIFGESATLAQQLQREGNQVRFYVKDKKMQDVARRLVPRVRDWKTHKDWADVIVFDDVDCGKEIESLRNRGYLVVGGNRFGDRIENDRLFAQKMMRETGMKLPPSWRFKNFKTAAKFIKKRPKRYVIKVSGQPERYTCYLGKSEDGFDLLKMIENLEESWPKKRRIDFILQEWIEGIEMATGAFFNGKEFASPVNISFEHKNFLTGGLGPLTGEMGTSMFYSETGGKLFRETLSRMKPYLAKTNYRGFIDLNCIVTKKAAYPIDFTARFGYPQIDIQQELHKTPWGELLYKVANGTLKHFDVYKKYAIGVIMGGAGMPYEISYNKFGKDLPILGLTHENMAYIKLAQAYAKDGRFYTGGTGYVLTINGSGKTMEAAKKMAYERLKEVIIPNAVYRLDIGDHWKTEEAKLKDWGYL